MIYILILISFFNVAFAEPEIVSTKKIWDKAPHSAFTDLINFKENWYCIFRESDQHVGGSNGHIRLIKSVDDGKNWTTAAFFNEEGIDLRDPKLSITPDGRLMILMGGTDYGKDGIYVSRQPKVAFSDDGENWGGFTQILEPHEWLWRVTWHEGKAYGVSYRFYQKWSTVLFESADGIFYRKITEFDIPGNPNEATLQFLDSGEMIALVRRKGKAVIGKSFPPYVEWEWNEGSCPLGGPNFVILPDGSMWASGREIRGDKESTILAKMTPTGFEKVLDLPSGGDDTSYPGMVYRDGYLWISYYSSHEEDKASIYLVKIKL